LFAAGVGACFLEATSQLPFDALFVNTPQVENPNLVGLNVQANAITILPLALARIVNLRTLNASDNRLVVCAGSLLSF
jgi:Leucine-rich repeat (LRR) protein